MKEEMESMRDQQRALIKLLQQKDTSLAKLNKYDNISGGMNERKVAVQDRLERLSEKLADEGSHEAAELMLDERHIALKRCFNQYNKLKSVWLQKWFIITQN